MGALAYLGGSLVEEGERERERGKEREVKRGQEREGRRGSEVAVERQQRPKN